MNWNMKAQDYVTMISVLYGINHDTPIFKYVNDEGVFICESEFDIGHIKPYLFLLSSMTEEQKYDFYCRVIDNDCDFDDFKEFQLDYGKLHKLFTTLDDIDSIIDWFHKNHFDYRGLIENGLANDATGLDIYR